MPTSLAVVFLVAPVASLVTTTEAPAITAPLVSWTSPVITPKSLSGSGFGRGNYK